MTMTVFVLIFLATNFGWFCVCQWIDRSWHERFYKMNSTWVNHYIFMNKDWHEHCNELITKYCTGDKEEENV